jgi:hypothetical protein
MNLIVGATPVCEELRSIACLHMKPTGRVRVSRFQKSREEESTIPMNSV